MPRGATALMIDSRHAEAASAFEQALALDPNCYEANQLLRRSFVSPEGDFERAAQALPCARWRFSPTTIGRRFPAASPSVSRAL